MLRIFISNTPKLMNFFVVHCRHKTNYHLIRDYY